MAMEAVIFIGIQAVGKSSFYKQRLFKTHVRINLDMLRTRHRENILLEACLHAKQSFVVDNTNPTIEERARYIQKAKSAGFRVIGYYFQSNVQDAIGRNDSRPDGDHVPTKAILGTYKKLQLPSMNEGFDALYYVRFQDTDSFVVQEWTDEIR